MLTAEQEAVVHHPRGKHARVLAVAGSGKTTTMAHRVRHLVMDQRLDPRRIVILQFNTLARVQFRQKFDAVGIPSGQRPDVHTFHSFAYKLIGEGVSAGLLPGLMDPWTGDKEEQARLAVHEAIRNLTRGEQIEPDSVDVDTAVEAISLWKGSLIPPANAGYYGNDYVPLVYAEYERIRRDRNGLTFDDFIPIAVGMLESEPRMQRRWCGTAEQVIVDEYQDVNYGQQRLIELVAGDRADIMVVGDDDQTIYEWRGARPNYILSEFRTVFANKPHVDYQLSRTFRFGPVLARSAENVIAFNQTRILKPLVAHDATKHARIHLILNTSEQQTDVNKELAEQIKLLVRETKDPRSVIVLGRMFSQLMGLEAQFLAAGIPYRVLGRAPFFERREIRVLLDYVRVALALDDPVTPDQHERVLNIANTPSRRLQRDLLARTFENAQLGGLSTRRVLAALLDPYDSPLARFQRDAADDWLACLDRLNERLRGEPALSGGILFPWLVERLDYLRHFDNYFGKGENSEDRKRAVRTFCAYAADFGRSAPELLRHVERLDTTRGVPEDQQIVMTTIYRTKGLEYDYVIIPTCEEGYMPYASDSPALTYDRTGQVADPPASAVIENERRLFYVAVTRARKAVFIGAEATPREGSQSASAVYEPSRFIDEMELEPTVEVMTALQRYAAGEPEARRELLERAARHAGRKRVVGGLLRDYGPHLRDRGLADEIRRLVDAAPEQPFAYRPKPAHAPRPAAAPATKPASRPWWEEDEE